MAFDHETAFGSTVHPRNEAYHIWTSDEPRVFASAPPTLNSATGPAAEPQGLIPYPFSYEPFVADIEAHDEPKRSASLLIKRNAETMIAEAGMWSY